MVRRERIGGGVWWVAVVVVVVVVDGVLVCCSSSSRGGAEETVEIVENESLWLRVCEKGPEEVEEGVVGGESVVGEEVVEEVGWLVGEVVPGEVVSSILLAWFSIGFLF